MLGICNKLSTSTKIPLTQGTSKKRDQNCHLSAHVKPFGAAPRTLNPGLPCDNLCTEQALAGLKNAFG